MNLDELLRESARRRPTRPAIIGPGPEQRLSYSELDAAIEERSRKLQRAGIARGDSVGVHLAGGAEYIVSTYALWRCGACAVPIPVELAPEEKRNILREIPLHALISEEQEAGFAAGLAGRTLAPPAAGQCLLEVESSRPAPAGFAEINAAFIRFTSGTTGDFKGVVLSHRTILERIHAANAALRLSSDDRVVWLLSMSYHFAVSIVGYLTYGATILLPEDLFATAILRCADEHRGTFIYGSPLQYSWMVDCRSDARLKDLRLAVSTTSPLTRALGEAFERRFGLPLVQALGIIEVGLPCINVDFASTRPEAVGRVLPAYEMRLRETDAGSGLHELLLRGPGFLDAYYHPWRLRDEIMPDGWFATGDVCRVDDQGCVELHGRSKDVMNISGMKFFPQETEAVLCQHPGISAARVFPVSHPRWGEMAHAQVIAATGFHPLPSPAELSVWCRQRLAPYKAPTDFEFVTEFPKTASGKVFHRTK